MSVDRSNGCSPSRLMTSQAPPTVRYPRADREGHEGQRPPHQLDGERLARRHPADEDDAAGGGAHAHGEPKGGERPAPGPSGMVSDTTAASAPIGSTRRASSTGAGVLSPRTRWVTVSPSPVTTTGPAASITSMRSMSGTVPTVPRTFRAGDVRGYSVPARWDKDLEV